MVQATGASILRKALILAVEAGMDVVAPLHNAIYILHDEKDIASLSLLKRCMNQASKEFIDIDIRLDSATYDSKIPWVEDKGRTDYERFKKYLIS